MIEIIPNPHPLFVHFPIALIGASLLFHLGAWLFGGHPLAGEWRAVARWTLWLGALSTLPTALFGWLAFNSVDHDAAGHAAMLLHRQFALIAVVASLCVAAVSFRARKRENEICQRQSEVSSLRPTVAAWQALLVAALFALIGATAWLGGEVVYRHGIGVLALPEKESAPPQIPAQDGLPGAPAEQAAPPAHGDDHPHDHAH